MDKTKIVCLVGESGSGKSTIGELLEKEGYRYISSFTTRKPRFEGERGHIFTTMKQYECNRATGIIVAETFFDGEYYWTTKGQFYGECIYVVDPVGVKDLKEKMKDAEIVVIYLKTDQSIRYDRMKEREMKNSITELYAHKKVLQRLIHDEDAFRVIPADYVVSANNIIEEVLKDVRDVIKRS